MITADDVQSLVKALDEGRQDWINGELGSSGDGSLAQHEDMTLFAPFGGEVVRGLGDLKPRQARAVSQFRGGTGTSELVKAIVAGDVVTLVLTERSDVTFEGRDSPHPWVLRVTEVFQRQGTQWARLHRHADPLIQRRTLDDTLALLGEHPRASG